MKLRIPEEIQLVEVGLRDGLQVVEKPIATSDKVRLVERLLDAGVRHIEAVSFAHPRTLPQLADAEEVMALVPRDRGATYRGLVPNLRGAERAGTCGLDEVVALTCADETVTQINQNRSVDEVLEELPKIAATVATTQARLVVGVAMAFFAPGRGVMPAADRNRCIEAAVDAGADGIYLGCSTGMEDPRQVSEGVADLRARHPHLRVGVHLHARNGMGLANAFAAMSAGADWLEGAFGGLGGDLWAPGPKEVLGNVPFEDLVHLFDSMGVATGVDLEAYLKVVSLVESLTDWKSLSAVAAGGRRDDLAEFRWPDRVASEER